jgi:cell division protein FtsI (penicillin-binding protein 3)
VATDRIVASIRRMLVGWAWFEPSAPREPPSQAWRSVVRGRVRVAAVVFGLWAAAIQARLVQLQVVQHDELVARAERQQLRTVPAPAKRGDIHDRRGRVLAYSVDADSIYAVPSEIERPGEVAAALCGALEHCSAREERTIAERLSRRGAFAYVRRQVSPQEARSVAALGLEGIGFHRENRRYYPNKELASHLLGYVGTDNTGLHGVEAAYDRQIRGRPGKILIQTDARHHAFSRIERPPTSGATIELTIDEHLQHIAERELRAGVAANRASGGTVVIMDPNTGELLAMANEPTFNPNSFLRFGADERRNRAIQDLYEPGSTFKMVTAAAALEERVVRPDDPFDVSAGMIRFGGRQIDDVHRYGTLSFTDVIVKSSNVGAIKVGMRLGPERLGRYIRRFGFGRPSSRDFQGESAGIVWEPSRLGDSALASVSMGYQVGVTAIQMAAAASAIGNGGELLEPRLVRAVVRDGTRVETARQVVRRAISRETATVLTGIMEAVVDRGTAQAAAIEGFTVAGKTGTAAKLVGGRYSKSEYNASFVGVVPSRAPALTILVVIDSPRAHSIYGGAVAAPVFRRIAEGALRQLGIGPTVNAEPLVIVKRESHAEDVLPTHVSMIRNPRVAADEAAAPDYMPDLLGLSAREALRVTTNLGLILAVTGSGFVVEQSPPPGLPLTDMATATIRLDRRPRATAAGDASP